MEPKFSHIPLKIIEPSFGSPLTDTIIELEQLRVPYRNSRVNPNIFSQLKNIFHTLESLGSVRIEGNNTTLSDVVEKTIDGSLEKTSEEKIKEYLNTRKALEFIDRHIKAGTPIDKKLISEFHKLTVQELNPSDEGDYTPGQYRTTEVSIKNSLHKPPLAVKVPEYMDELIAFINEARPQKLKLLAIAITHHRFAWIHPFRNGNGRTIRLLTYAMLISQGFAVNHILNPTAVFCNDRSQYYKMLAKADKGSGAGLLEWCTYVLQNLLEEIKKIDRLLDYDYLIQTILFPALAHALERKNINSEEYQILKLAVEKGVIMAKDVNQILRKKYPTLVSAVINKLKKEELLTTLPDKQRSYFVSFINNHLLRAVIEQLRKESFITSSLG